MGSQLKHELERKSIHTITEVFRKLDIAEDLKLREFELDGDMINAKSDRYLLFRTKGMSCLDCGITGSFFAKEKHRISERYHLNLYAVNESGDEVLMTKDHLKSKADGGKNHISNYGTRCKPCNEKKGSVSSD